MTRLKFLFMGAAIFFSTACFADPLVFILNQGPGLVESMKESAQLVQQAIQILEKHNPDKRIESLPDLDREHLAEVSKNLYLKYLGVDARIEAFKVETNRLLEHTRRGDRAKAISTLSLSNIEQRRFRDFRFAEDTVSSVIGLLKSLRFSIANAAGNFALATDATLIDFTPESLRDSMDIPPRMKLVFEGLWKIAQSLHLQMKSELNSPGKSVGSRTITYVDGFTIAFKSTNGPSDLQPQVALKNEVRISQNLLDHVRVVFSTGVISRWLPKVPTKVKSCFELL